jgi:hypothetical protein
LVDVARKPPLAGMTAGDVVAGDDADDVFAEVELVSVLAEGAVDDLRGCRYDS